MPEVCFLQKYVLRLQVQAIYLFNAILSSQLFENIVLFKPCFCAFYYLGESRPRPTAPQCRARHWKGWQSAGAVPSIGGTTFAHHLIAGRNTMILSRRRGTTESSLEEGAPATNGAAALVASDVPLPPPRVCCCHPESVAALRLSVRKVHG